MALTERQRRDLFGRLDEVLGSPTADHLMQMLPRVTNDQLATSADLDQLGTVLRGEMSELRGELRGEMAELRTDLDGRMSELRTDLVGQMGELRADVRTEIAGLQRWVGAAAAANAVAVIAALLT